ncbi:MAG: Dabb family protein [Planctomycetota bacterium]|nr:Dabb family protein [Planctomycetota bacterium]MDA1251994.1 Dabb family protein [Planctomycetota bacterium]
MRSLTLTLAVMLTLACFSTSSAEDLKKGDRVIFLGDSITQAGVGPKGFVSLVRNTINEKIEGVEVIGAGISGNKVTDLENRLEKDVLSKKPTVVVIYIGINDVWHSIRDRGTPRDRFESGLKDIIGQINEAGARVILCTPSMIGEKTDGSNSLDVMLEEFSATSRKVAVETKSQLFDLRARFLKHLRIHNPKQAERGILTSDTVHLNEAGNEFVASCMLEALGVNPVEQKQILRHVVLFKFKEDVTAAQIDEVTLEFAKLPSKIEAIVEFEWGTDVSVEGKSKGFTHAFVVGFRDAAGRDEYLPHAAHEEFVKLVGPLLDDVLVFDFHVGR